MERTTGRNYRGECENSDAANHAEHQAKLQKKTEIEDANSVEKELPKTQRDVRRVYKITLAAMHEQWSNEDEGERATGDQDGRRYDQKDCLRCMLIEAGTSFVSDRIICTGTFSVSEGLKVVTESMLINKSVTIVPESLKTTAEYMRTLATTTALGATLGTRVNVASESFAKLLPLRRLRDAPTIIESNHRCADATRPRTRPSRVAVRGVREETSPTTDHVLIFATTGMGKTTFQHELCKRDIVVLDTDDVPSLTARHLRELLTWTSVLTNRMDLLDPELRTVAFVPRTPQVLRERGKAFGTMDETDVQYLFQCMDFSKHKRAICCMVEHTYMSDWFDLQNVPIASTGAADGELGRNLVRKIARAGQAHDIEKRQTLTSAKH